MTMLSSVAERLYWTARYLERAESMACLTNAYTQFILDIPKGFEPGWGSLIRVIDGEDRFFARYKKYSERSVLRFLIADPKCSGSIRYSVNAARENVRTTRHCLPEPFWELVNELHIFTSENSASAVARRSRFEFLDTVAAKMQQLSGVIYASMTRDHAYRFMRIGGLIECADMTSRVVDVATTTTLKHGDDAAPEVTWLWANLLRSLSAVSAYRREAGPVVNAGDIIDFIFKSESFARSIHYCLNGIAEETASLKNRQNVNAILDDTRDTVLKFNTDRFTLDRLHGCVDRLQLRLIQLNQEIYSSWFAR